MIFFQIKNILLLFLFVFSFIACNTDGENGKRNIDPVKLKEPLINANKVRVMKESKEIDSYIKRHKWKMEDTGTGLRYHIYNKGDREKATKGKTATINYRIGLLDGTECYSSDSSGVKSFEIGRGNVESGLEEGILLMKVGDKAKFILPSHLAYGLLGDSNKIPSYAVLVYDVELIALK